MITEKICKAFPGISALISALKRAWKAYLAYINAIEGLNNVVVLEPINEWAQTASERSKLSYEDALRLYTFIKEERGLYNRAEICVTEFVVEMANRGHTADMIIFYLQQIDREVNKGAHDKLRMPP